MIIIIVICVVLYFVADAIGKNARAEQQKARQASDYIQKATQQIKQNAKIELIVSKEERMQIYSDLCKAGQLYSAALQHNDAQMYRKTQEALCEPIRLMRLLLARCKDRNPSKIYNELATHLVLASTMWAMSTMTNCRLLRQEIPKDVLYAMQYALSLQTYQNISRAALYDYFKAVSLMPAAQNELIEMGWGDQLDLVKGMECSVGGLWNAFAAGFFHDYKPDFS